MEQQPIKAAIIQNGVVSNIIWIMPEQLHEFGAIPIITDGVGIGWLYQDGHFIDPNPPVIEENIIEG